MDSVPWPEQTEAQDARGAVRGGLQHQLWDAALRKWVWLDPFMRMETTDANGLPLNQFEPKSCSWQPVSGHFSNPGKWPGR